MKELLKNEKYLHWPIISICHFAKRIGEVSVSPQTWYKYNRIFQLRKSALIYKKPRYGGIVANFPNQYWHADITIYKTEDQVKHFIYLVCDNFSRKILSWDISKTVSATMRLTTLKEAYGQIQTNDNIKLIVDGGPENNNKLISNFINSTENRISKYIALKDISFSNSMIEATNKILKYRYLFPKHIANGKELRKVLKKSIYDFNNIRPHGKLNGLTPDEAYSGKIEYFILK